jgi:exopolyphosphatase/guanosine-5'-triphosphate,3'-diphosphate pyrophosphatase
LETSHRLNPEGKKIAIEAMGRFVRLAQAMGVAALDVLATAAVREAEDGPAFVHWVEERYGVSVTILSGEEEARLAALGVLCGTPEADGLVADLGGGSLEAVALDHGHFSGPFMTMPLGVLRLWDASAGGLRAFAEPLIDRHFAGIDWWSTCAGKTLYCVGGAWRALARLCIAQTGHPLHVLDNFTLGPNDAFRLTDLIAHQSRKSLEKVPGISKKRLPYLPLAALVLEKLLLKVKPAQLVFSVYGVREGQFFKRLPPDMRWSDPLVASCADMARTAGRFPEHGEEMQTWMSPLFEGESAAQKRLRLAACLLGDVFWNEHPDYRAEQAFLRVFRLPFMGLGHQDRAALALAIFARYNGDEDFPTAADARNLLPLGEEIRWQRVGLALRLGYSLSGGVPGLLSRTTIAAKHSALQIMLPADDDVFAIDVSDRRYERQVRTAGYESFEIRRV